MKKKIICPYCSENFWPDEVHFRLPNAIEGEEQTQQADVGGNAFGRKSSGSFTRNNQDNRTIDQKLVNYYMKYRQASQQEAESSAMAYPAIPFDAINRDIEFDEHKYNEYGYVLEIKYKGMKTSERLCPHCHNKVIPNAGEYDMKIISIVGDTDVGKTVYLSMLQEMIQDDPNMDGTLMFMGTDAERELYLRSRDNLVDERKIVDATVNSVPPLPFLYTYKVKANDGTQRIQKLIVFCDIPGEKCRKAEDLQEYGPNLIVSSGILFLLDPIRFNYFKQHNFQIDLENYQNRNSEQIDIFAAIQRYLVANVQGQDTVTIPTAVVLSKADVLADINSEVPALLDRSKYAQMHPGYLQNEKIEELNQKIEKLMHGMQEDRICRNVDNCFSNYNWFIVSSLGEPPIEVKKADGTIQKSLKGVPNPIRVTEPFYWLLAQNNDIPLRYVCKMQHEKSGEEKIIEIYYLKKQEEYLKEIIEEECTKNGVNRNPSIVDKIRHNVWIEISNDGEGIL